MIEFCSGYRCSICYTEYDLDSTIFICPNDGGNLDVILDIRCIKQNFHLPDYFGSNENSMWRYLPLLPVEDPMYFGTPLRTVGWTPFYQLPHLCQCVDHNHLWVKDESRNPTASLKDRASALVVVKAREKKAEIIITASTGNAGAALAGMSAAIAQKSIILAPKTAPPAKIAQLMVYGANVFLIDGTYDDAFDLAIVASKENNWYCRNTGYNPFTVEGKKTVAYEIWEFSKIPSNYQFRKKNWNIFISVGDGNIITGIHKGFKDLVELGWLDHLPRIYGIQAEGSASITNSFFSESKSIIPVVANTIADSISVNLPRDGLRAIRAMKESGTQPILVSDQEILRAISDLGKSGIFSEPAGAASFAGFRKAKETGLIANDEPVVVINSGSGLKDIEAARKAITSPPVIQPSISDLMKVVKSFIR